jgi:ketosteroid isomerase-like protein
LIVLALTLASYHATPVAAAPAVATRARLAELVNQWTDALKSNDAERIAAFTAADWILIGADGSVMTRKDFLALIRSGSLQHNLMQFDPDRISVDGDVAIVSGIARSGGTFKGHPFATHERASDVFVLRKGRWRCLLTQLSPLTRH